MSNITLVGVAVAVIVLGLTLSPLTQHQAGATMEETSTQMKATTPAGVKVTLSWMPVKIEPSKEVTFTLKFFDKNGAPIDNATYDFMLIREGSHLTHRSLQPIMQGTSLEKFTFKQDQTGPLTLRLENINLTSGENADFSLQVVDGKMMDGKMMDGKMMDGKMMDGKMMDGKVLEGWLVDMQSGYKLSIGQLDGNTLVFTQKMVNPFIYDLFVITEEPLHDTNPSPDMPIGGAQLAEPFAQ